MTSPKSGARDKISIELITIGGVEAGSTTCCPSTAAAPSA